MLPVSTKLKSLRKKYDCIKVSKCFSWLLGVKSNSVEIA